MDVLLCLLSRDCFLNPVAVSISQMKYYFGKFTHIACLQMKSLACVHFCTNTGAQA
jgi:hypothetical protein